MKRLQDKVAVVTGGGTGIGKAICLEFAREGAQVVVVSIVQPEADSVAEEVCRQGRTGLSFAGDVTDVRALCTIADQVRNTFGAADILVTSAGVMGERTFITNMSDDGWRRTIVLTDIPQPSPGQGEVLVRLRANSLNRADLMMLKGTYLGGLGGMGFPLGLEWAGEVVEVGAAVENWHVGDHVMAAGLAAFAEYTIGYARRMYAIPEAMSFEQAATLPVALQTMHDAISTNGMLAAGQTVLT
jgi:hypothetical protein